MDSAPVPVQSNRQNSCGCSFSVTSYVNIKRLRYVQGHKGENFLTCGANDLTDKKLDREFSYLSKVAKCMEEARRRGPWETYSRPEGHFCYCSIRQKS